MIFVFGGAYQGKLDFAKENFNITSTEIYTVEDGFDLNAIDNRARCIDGLDKWIHELIFKEGSGGEPEDTSAILEAFVKQILERDKASDKTKGMVIIMNDVSQGLVPMDAKERAFREANGRAMIKLAETADEVYRVFCGIGIKIK